MPQHALVHQLGLTPYEPAWALQRALQRELIDARGGGTGAAPHRVLLVEHPHVFTLGKNGDATNLLAASAQLAQREATFVPVDRGGDITYHGPGQLVVYPILDLERLHYPDGRRATDVHRYLRELEEAVIGVCGDWGVDGHRLPGKTGVWLGPDERGPERKICAMGIRCSRWVTMHGLALNVDPDLSYFDLIVPCGIANCNVTSIRREADRAVRIEEVIPAFLTHFAERFGLELELRPPTDGVTASTLAPAAEPSAA